MKEIIRFIHSHLAVQFNIRELAVNLRCHPDYLGRKFKQHTASSSLSTSGAPALTRPASF